MTIDLPFLMAGLIAFAVLAYVVLDGFDLGVGILFPLLDEEREKTQAMNSIAPVWDGNETWLILGGGGLLAAFPLAYAVVMPALYAPLIAMLLGLIFRGVAFEFRWRTHSWRRGWDAGFAAGSTVAAFAQGIMVGALVQGIPVANRAYAGGWWDWFTPFSVLTGLALVIGYALLGATWLISKTEGELQQAAYGYARWAGVGLLIAIALVSAWTPFLDRVYFQRWLAWPTLLFTGIVPLLVAFFGYLLFTSLRDHHERWPFRAALALFALSFVGLGISFYPFIVPPTVTIWQAAAPDSSLLFILVGAGILLPMILAYTAHAYWVFRGKVDAEGSYH